MRDSTARTVTAVLAGLAVFVARPPSAQAFTLISVVAHPAMEAVRPATTDRVERAPDDDAFYGDTIWGVPCKIRVWVKDDDLYIAMRAEPRWRTADDQGPRIIDTTFQIAGVHLESPLVPPDWADPPANCASKRHSWELPLGESDDREWLMHIKKDWLAQIIAEDSAAPPDPDEIILRY